MPADRRQPSRTGAAVRSTPRRVLVTGASGFVGSAVREEFEAAGHQVTGTSTSGGDGLVALDLGRPERIAEVLQEVAARADRPPGGYPVGAEVVAGPGGWLSG